MPELNGNETISFFYKSSGKAQSIYINGKDIANRLPENNKGNIFVLPGVLLINGRYQIAITASPLLKPKPWEEVNTNKGLIQILTQLLITNESYSTDLLR